MFARLRHILEMIRFSHTLFAVPFALLAAVMAWTTPVASHAPGAAGKLADAMGFRASQLLGILVCMVCARSAAMAMNRMVDRRIDAANTRTMSRHLVTGALSVPFVAMFTVLASLGFVAGTCLFLPNRLPLYLAVPVLAFLLGYSYAKRFTSLAHVWLGAALMLAPLSAWIAIRGQVLMAYPTDALPAAWLGLAVLLWVTGFDMIYACQDVDFDRKAHLHSVPVTFGVENALRMAAACHAGMLLVLAVLPWLCPQLSLGWIYGIGISCVGALLIYEHALVRPDDLTRVNVAFFHVNAVLSIGLFLVGTLDLLT